MVRIRRRYDGSLTANSTPSFSGNAARTTLIAPVASFHRTRNSPSRSSRIANSLADSVWTLALAWTGAACLVNAARCGRMHCRYTGPFYLALIVPTLVAGWADASTPVWIALGGLVLSGGKGIWWGGGRGWGRW